MKIDAHHNLWRYLPEEYEWIDDRMHALRRDFLPVDLERELELAHVQAAVASTRPWVLPPLISA
jgi:L-fuconolactonase